MSMHKEGGSGGRAGTLNLGKPFQVGKFADFFQIGNFVIARLKGTPADEGALIKELHECLSARNAVISIGDDVRSSKGLLEAFVELAMNARNANPQVAFALATQNEEITHILRTCDTEMAALKACGLRDIQSLLPKTEEAISGVGRETQGEITTFHRHGNVMVVRVDAGDLDFETYKPLVADIGLATENALEKVVLLNLGNVTHMDQMGLGAVSKMWKEFDKGGKKLVLCNLAKNVKNLIKLINLDGRIAIRASEEEALREFG